MIKLGPAAKDLTGLIFGDLTVLYPVGRNKHDRGITWACRCVCGELVHYAGKVLRAGKATSCGSSTCKRRRAAAKIEDLTGRKFGRLSVLYRTDELSGHSYKWMCRCDCGVLKAVSRDQLMKGETVSCGCYQREHASKWSNDTERKLAGILHNMKQRCFNKNDANYPNWGARGVVVCPEWMDPDTGTRAFIDWALSHGWRPGLTIERDNKGEFEKDKNGPYSPSNCSIATIKRQANNRRNNRFITVGGRTQSVSDWAIQLGVDPHVLWCKSDEYITDYIISRCLFPSG